MLTYIALFFSGFCLVNTVPHFVHGVSGKSFPSPPGVGDSLPSVNVLWSTFNPVVGYVLLAWAGFFDIGLNAETAAWFAGLMVVSIMLAVIFGKVMRER